MIKIISSQGKEISLSMEIKDVENYGDLINFLIVKAIKNIVRYTDYTIENILKEDYSFDNFYFKICENYNLANQEDYSNKEYLQELLKRFKTKFIRQTEYEIYLLF